MVAVPVRCCDAAFSETATVAVPSPEPPPETLRNPSLLAAVHAQLAEVETDTPTVEAPAPTDAVLGEMLNWHAAAACVSVSVWPPTVTAPCRCAVAEFAAKVNGTFIAP